MAKRSSLRVHAFCSVKGGVGKSALAVASAEVMLDQGRRPLVLDADLTGTSLADGLRMEAPRLPKTGGALELGPGRLGFMDDTSGCAADVALGQSALKPSQVNPSVRNRYVESNEHSTS